MLTFSEYFSKLTDGQLDRLAAHAKTKPVYLYQLAKGIRRPSPDLARRLHAATGKRVSLHALRPDIWEA